MKNKLAISMFGQKRLSREARQSMLDAYPGLKKMYAADDGNTEVFYFKNGVATIDVIENNTTAEKLYQKLGFQYVQTKTLYYDVVGKMTFKLYELVL